MKLEILKRNVFVFEGYEKKDGICSKIDNGSYSLFILMINIIIILIF